MLRVPFKPNRRDLLAGTAAAAAVLAAPSILRAEQVPLKVGVLLPRSGFEAGIGQDCQRGVDMAPAILKSLGLPALAIMDGDTESNVDTARARAEKLINDGAQLLIGAFDSGQSAAIAQVAEQKGIPFVINIAAAPDITEQGYKFVFRNFPTAAMILGDAFANQQEVFGIAGVAPKSVVFMHVNDTFGTAMSKGINAMMPKFNMPYKVVDEIAYDPAARDLSVEVAKAKAANADALLRGQPAQRCDAADARTGQAALDAAGDHEHGAGLVRRPISQDARQAVRRADQLRSVPGSEQEARQGVGSRARQADPGVNLSTNHVYTFEALLIAADAYKRAGSADPKALADAIRATNITDNVSIGPGIQFNAKGQNDKLKNGAIQNRGGKLVTLAPKEAANAKPEWPMKPYQNRG